MRDGEAVKLVRAGPAGLVALLPGGSRAKYGPGETVWLPLSARILGEHTVVIARARRPIEKK